MRGFGAVAVLGIIFAFGWFALAFAQEGSMPPPPPPQQQYQPPQGGEFGGNRMPPPPQGGFQGGYRQPQEGGQYQQGNFQQRPQMSPQGEMMRGEPQQFGGQQQGGNKQEMMQNRGGDFGGGYGGDFGGDSGGYYGGGGEDDSEARQAEMEEREKQMETQRLNEMKRNFRGMEQGMKMIKTMMDKLAKQNVSVPSEYATLLSDLTQALAVVKGATEMTDEVESAMEVIMDRGEELRDIGPKLGMLSQWPKTVKQAEAQVRRLATQFARVKKNKTAASYPALLAKVEASVGTVTGALAQAKSEAAGDDLETAMDTLRDGVFEATEDAYNAMRVLENMANISRVVKQAEKEIARYEKEATRYEKKKQDVSALRELIAEMKRVLAEVKSAMSDTSADPEELFDVMNSAEELRNDAEAELQHLRGRPSSAEKQIQSNAAERAGASIGKALDGLKTK
ncbi:MAG: hypothetical protein A3C08_01095 [Candidatus Taylorbacteria bacterium RIFCSPHIGHO2_02_FULL_47_18]|nr:MAG: hypothetical protein A3C08_01095 [Candidatus Taylorbacteria bacterium RIFCSPHIGHO2_02_FULL_47_18]